MKARLMRMLAVVLLVSAVAVGGYPYAEQVLYAGQAKKGMEQFVEDMQRMRGQRPGGASLPDELYALLAAENKRIFEQGQMDLVDPFSYQQTAVDLSGYGIYDNVIAYITVPAMDISLPILLGASEENMRLGAAHLTQTSYPIGGANTNSVLAAHRGYSKAAMFRDIERLQVGDAVYIHGIDGKLTYRVSETKIILPTEVDQVLIQPGRDMVTLITCHPYRQNKQRYIVFCDRVES